MLVTTHFPPTLIRPNSSANQRDDHVIRQSHVKIGNLYLLRWDRVRASKTSANVSGYVQILIALLLSYSTEQLFFSWNGLWSVGPLSKQSFVFSFSQYSIKLNESIRHNCLNTHSFATSDTFLRWMLASARSCSVVTLACSILARVYLSLLWAIHGWDLNEERIISIFCAKRENAHITVPQNMTGNKDEVGMPRNCGIFGPDNCSLV